MPVLLYNQDISCSSFLYITVGCVVLFIGAVILRRNRKLISRRRAEQMLQPKHSEKSVDDSGDTAYTHAHTHAPPPPSPHALPLRAPTLFTFSMRASADDDSLSNEYRDSPTETKSSSFYFSDPLLLAGTGEEGAEKPRRRSYTKTNADGSSVSGEILQVSRRFTLSPDV